MSTGPSDTAESYSSGAVTADKKNIAAHCRNDGLAASCGASVGVRSVWWNQPLWMLASSCWCCS
jgi:hypothetical protein